MEGAEHRILCRARRATVVDRVDQHGDAERVGKQDELLPFVRAHLASLSKEIDRELPLGLREMGFLDEAVDMLDEAGHYLFQPRGDVGPDTGVDGFDRTFLAEILEHLKVLPEGCPGA